MDRYNYARHHERLNELIPADAHYGHSKKVLSIERKVRQRTLEERRRLHCRQKVASMTFLIGRALS